MRVVSNRALIDFAGTYPAARVPLQAWRRAIQTGTFAGFADLKVAFRSVDKVGRVFVSDIGGHEFRPVAAIHFDRQILYVCHVLTHREYDDWTP